VAVGRRKSDSKLLAYVGDEATNTIGVVDVNARAVIATIPLPASPREIVMNKDGSKVYVTCSSLSKLVAIDTATNGSAVQFGFEYPLLYGLALSPDETKIYFTEDARPHVANLPSGLGSTEFLYPATLPRTWANIALNPSGTRLYATNYGSFSPHPSRHNLTVYDTTTLDVVAEVELGERPVDVAVHPNQPAAFVADILQNRVYDVDLTTNTVRREISTGKGPSGVVFSAAGTEAIVANSLDNTLAIVQVASGSVTGSVTLPGKPIDVAADPSAAMAYVTLRNATLITPAPPPIGALDPLLIPEGVGQVTGIHVDAAGKIYIANGTLVRVNGMTGAGGVRYPLNGARGVFVDSTNVYTAGSGDKLKRSALDGTGVVEFGPSYPPGVGGVLNGPSGILLGNGKIYFSDTGNNIVQRMDDMTGAGLNMELFSSGSNPIGLAHLATGNRLYVAWAGGHFITENSTSGTIDLGTPGIPGSGVGTFNSPRGIALDSSGRIYVADNGNHRIVRMNDITGAGWTTFGTQGSGVNQFKNPSAIFVDGSNIYVGDTGNGRIVRISDMSGSGWTEMNTLKP
jgi:YVTN family beta-propeller protein